MIKRSVAIIGGGVSGIMLAAHLDETKFEVSIYEKGKAAGRKFLVAGDGGLNLTHSEDSVEFINKYTAPEFIKKAFQKFDNEALVKWFSSIGIETFVGSSKRVFPLKGIKPVTVLNAMMKKLEEKNVKINYGFSWKGWKEESILFLSKENEVDVKADIVVFAMGGGSWKVTGSDGLWTDYFKAKNIELKPLKGSNCEYCTTWPQK
ncbi:MAG: NAD(P)/FAD-dependent oxidoreductase, partial [Bacteroidia bacterium]|nr:NAD(P)/FAD-dependent oxidoreductase [Bacteroidia bacterium]